MVFGKTKLELKVGIFVFLGLMVLMIFILMIGKIKTWAAGYQVKTTFNFVNGVKIGAPVRYAGVDVGEVKHIDINFEGQSSKPKVTVISWVRNDIRIPNDSKVWVNTLGLLGEKYIEIIPGKEIMSALGDGGTLVGTDPISMNEIGDLAHKIVADIDESIVRIKDGEGTVGKLLYDDTIYKELEALVLDIRKHPWKLFFKNK
ncbi:MAG TPA: MlaD family protein [Candidatus Omnitrophota bacterium]|nr:MlaD family protein [Candidatus Omnitrophota bacterium]HNX82525.1 MlaD family protein [Candidatus Omnitrophota bacterium]HPT07357.1 MlaD family protein [Candidatus Omnitrophota bacterium]